MKYKLYYLVIFSLVFTGLFNGPILVRDFISYKSAALLAYLEIARTTIYLFIASFLLFFGLSSHRILFSLGSFLIFGVCGFAIYYIIAFGINITPEIIKVLFHNDIADALELISIKLLAWILSVFFIWIILIKKYLRIDKDNPTSFWYKTGSVLILIFSAKFLCLPDFILFKRFLPWQATSSFTAYLKKTPETMRIDIAKENDFQDTKKNEKIIVLVIGESARYDHFCINGYERDTTPHLKQNKNIFSFFANSCGNMTYLSVDCMLSQYGKKDFNSHLNESTIISVFNKLSFKTAWFGTQNIRSYYTRVGGGSFYDEPGLLIIPGGSALIETNAFDEKLLPFVEDFISKEGSKFLILHTVGSHWDYAKRYPDNFKKFEPDCPAPKIGRRDPRDCDLECLNAIYDNSILYTDYFLNNLFKLLAGKNSLVIYTSDHGDSLGENGFYHHGGPPHASEQFEVPFIVWGSEKFWQNNPDFKINLESKKEQGLKISHDYVFHSLLGCSNISSNILKPELNLCGN